MVPLASEQRDRNGAHPVVAVGLALALVFTGLNVRGFPSCQTCLDAQTASHRLIALGGALMYCVCATLFAFRPTRYAGSMLLAALAGAHAVLLKAMLDAGEWCQLCAATGVAVVFALLALVLGRSVSAHWLLVGVLGGTLVGIASVLWIAQSPSEDEALPPQYRNLLRRAESACRVKPESRCVVVFERVGCAACNVLTDETQKAELERRTGGAIRVMRLKAPDNVEAPTVLAYSRGSWTIFRGSPDQSQLAASLAR